MKQISLEAESDRTRHNHLNCLSKKRRRKMHIILSKVSTTTLPFWLRANRQKKKKQCVTIETQNG